MWSVFYLVEGKCLYHTCRLFGIPERAEEYMRSEYESMYKWACQFLDEGDAVDEKKTFCGEDHAFITTKKGYTWKWFVTRVEGM